MFTIYNCSEGQPPYQHTLASFSPYPDLYTYIYIYIYMNNNNDTGNSNVLTIIVTSFKKARGGSGA